MKSLFACMLIAPFRVGLYLQPARYIIPLESNPLPLLLHTQLQISFYINFSFLFPSFQETKMTTIIGVMEPHIHDITISHLDMDKVINSHPNIDDFIHIL